MPLVSRPRGFRLLSAATCCWCMLLLIEHSLAFLTGGCVHGARGRQLHTARAADYTLRYFDGRGVAETARILFAVAGQPFEDRRYPISFGTPGDFSTLKREEFDADKAAGKMEVAMGKVPVLEVGSTSIPQSKAIERYLARQFGMMGSNPEEEAMVDAMSEHVRDINDAYNKKGLFFHEGSREKAGTAEEVVRRGVARIFAKA